MEPVAHIATYYNHLARTPTGRPRKADSVAEEAIRLRLAGKTLREIAAELGIGRETARTLTRDVLAPEKIPAPVCETAPEEPAPAPKSEPAAADTPRRRPFDPLNPFGIKL